MITIKDLPTDLPPENTPVVIRVILNGAIISISPTMKRAR